MARILFGSAPASGHVGPGLPIARELVARGHDVVWYTGARFRGKVEATGARHAAFVRGRDFDETDLDGELPGRGEKKTGIPQLKFDIRVLFIDPIGGYLPDLRDLHEAEPFDAVVVEPTFMAGAMLAEEHGLPWAVYGIIPLIARSVDTAPTGLGLSPMRGPLGRLRNGALNLFVERVVFASEQRRLQQIRGELGFTPMREFFFNHAATHAPLFLQGGIPEFEYPRRDLSTNVRFVGALLPDPPGTSTLPDWWDDLDGDRPVVVVTQGTVKVDPRFLLYPAINALRDDDILVVATTGGLPPEDVPARYHADNVRIVPFVPFVDLLPKADVFVTNGGYGGVQQALAHGVPVVAAGITEGKVEVAARVGWSGAGLNLRSERPEPDRIRGAVRRLLDEPSFRQRAGELRRAYAGYDGPTLASDHLESLLAAR